MEEDNIEQNRNISGLSFKDLTPQEQDLVLLEENNEGFLFVNDDIEKKNFSKTFFLKLRIFLKRHGSKKNIFAFLIALVGYFYSRARVIWILTSVLFDLILEATDFVKEKLVRRMFWGRGNFLRSALQAILFIIVLILTVSYIYRKPVVIVASEDTVDTIGVAETDVLVMNATTNTTVPKDRGRREVERYVVKGGDTISSIAKNFGISIETLIWANDMSSKSVIKPGQTLQIPQGNGVLVVVKKGDTLASLAKKYKSDAQTIAEFNLLDYPFTLTAGEELFLPNGEEVEVKPTYASSPSLYVSNQYSGVKTVSGGDSKVGKFLAWPIAGSAKISRGYGYYYGYFHGGIDLASNALPKIVAPASGKVVFAGCYGTCPPMGSTYGGTNYAWSIQIDHGNGYTTWYAHLKNIYVRSGQTVKKGQVIGQMGSTGKSTGPHLHFELRRGSDYTGRVNPRFYTQW